MLASGTFRGAERSSQLLRFVVEQTLQGRADHLKDYTLGAEVLGRGERFDPRTDPIARVEASRLRSRLEMYYATEGAADPIIISLPKGGYVPQFETRSSPAPTEPEVAQYPSWRRRLPWALALLTVPLAFAGGLATQWLTADHPAAPEMRLEVSTPPTTDPVSLALSPDGRSIVFVASAAGTSRLWLRSLDSTMARPLAGTENASLPFWSPDSRAIGFFADARVKRIDVESGLVQVISRAVVPAGGAWSPGGVVLHPIVPDSPIFRVQADGSGAVPETTLAAGQTGHRAPHFLPDGRHFLFYAVGSPDVRGIHVGELGSAAVRRLIDADMPAAFAAPNHLLYVVHGTLFAHQIDLETMELLGDAIAIAEGIAGGTTAAVAALSTAASGPIAYRTGLSGGTRQFAWFDRSGKELSRISGLASFGPSYASISPDFHRLAVQRTNSGNTDIWVIDLDRNVPVRVTAEPQADIAPLWSPKGDRIVYSSLNGGVFNLYQRVIGAPASVELLKTDLSKQVTDWSRDGRWLLFRTIAAVGSEVDEDIWAMPLDGDRKPVPVVRTRFEERDAQFSPDGRWVAYQSNESGQYEIYVRPFQGEGETIRISPSGGVQVRWRADGRELFYLTLNAQLVAVPITSEADSKALKTGTGVPLFQAPVGAVQDTSLHHYIVSPDGQRFLIDTVIEETASPITILLNWAPRAN